MARFTGLICCLSVAVSFVLGAQSACGKEGLPVSKITTSVVKGLQLQPSNTKVDDVSIPEKILSPRLQKHLKLSSDIEGLADRVVSQPGAGAG
ncbi:MAG TPA: hypothetical protein V6C86_08360 [Oculatellaceae cyanobacterium]